MKAQSESRSREQTPHEGGSWTSCVFSPDASVPPEQPIFEGLLARGDLAIWLGREKHRKSNLLLQFAVCAALGRSFLHFPFGLDRGLKVVVLDYESKTQTLKHRYESLIAAMRLSEAEQTMLRENLQIIEMRKGFRKGLQFARFPVKTERGREHEFVKAEEQWRLFVQKMAAELYIVDPMRCMHAQAENDSTIEALLTRIHQFFGDAAVVISHHLRKRNRKQAQEVRLMDDMRSWADESRGSGAITAHGDVIVCQERTVESGVEILHFGAYLRDGADIEPLTLRESEAESFLWLISPDIPLALTLCLDELRKSAPEFPNRTAAAIVLQNTIGTGRSTAYARIKDLVHRGLLVEGNGALKIKETLDETAKST